MALIFGLFWLTSDNEKSANYGALWCADLETKKAPTMARYGVRILKRKKRQLWRVMVCGS
ncbi:hypothetical protein AAFT91_003571 [Salmonella enterica]